MARNVSEFLCSVFVCVEQSFCVAALWGKTSEEGNTLNEFYLYVSIEIYTTFSPLLSLFPIAFATPGRSANHGIREGS